MRQPITLLIATSSDVTLCKASITACKLIIVPSWGLHNSTRSSTCYMFNRVCIWSHERLFVKQSLQYKVGSSAGASVSAPSFYLEICTLVGELALPSP